MNRYSTIDWHTGADSRRGGCGLGDLLEGDLLCRTRIKVTCLFPNKDINFFKDYNKPPAFKSIHHSVEWIPYKASKRISSMATILGVHLVDTMIPV